MAIEIPKGTEPAYRNLVAEGVTAGTLSGSLDPSSTWTAEFFFTGPDKDKAKRAVTRFLEENYDAVEIAFFRNPKGDPKRFIAKFVRRDL